MLCLLLSALAFSSSWASRARVSHRELAQGKPYSFDEYLVDFKKSYPETQMDYRKTIFMKHLEIIREHNAGNHSFWMHVNDFTDMHPEEFRRSTRGFSHSKHAKLQSFMRTEAAPVDEEFLATLPTDVDWRKKGVVTAVKNQGGCGSCWAFSAAETVESHLAIATGKLMTLSEQQLVSCAPNPDECGGTGGCQGSTQPLAFKYLMTTGATTEDDYPYQGVTGTCDPSKIKAVVSVTDEVELPTNNYTALMEAIANVGPVAISVDAGGLSWQLYGGGVVKGDCGSDIDHAVQLVGYGTDKGDDYYIVRNSWGASWGEEGYIRLYRDANAECKKDTSPGDGFGCKGGPSEITVCGMCGILSGSSYPTGVKLME